MSAADKFRAWFRRGDPADATYASHGASADTAPTPVAPREAVGQPRDDATRGGDADVAWLGPDLPLAQDQELLGPCLDCAGYWTRIRVRGQKPLTCPGCKRTT